MDDLTRIALAARDGDQRALTDLVHRSQAEVWRLCRYLGGPAAADDLTQDTYLRALRALPTFRGESSARTWLLAIARHTIVDGIRRSARRRRTADAGAGPPVAPDPSGQVTVERLIAGLDQDRRTALVFTQVLGLSYAEAAEVCGVAVGTIRSRVARARAQLLDELGGEDVPAARWRQ